MLAPSGRGLILYQAYGNLYAMTEVPYDNRNNTPTEQEAANIMQSLKESQKTSRRKPGTGGSNEGTGSKPGVLDEFIVVYATSSEGTDIKLGVPDEEKDIKEEMDDKDGNVDDEGDDHISDTQDANDEDVKTESDEDDIYKYKIRVHKDEDEEMKDAKVEESSKGEEKVTDAAKEETEKTSEAKNDTKKTELAPSSSSLSVSSGFGDQFLKLSFDSSLFSIVKDSADTDVIAKLEKDVSELKTIDHYLEALVVLKSQVPSVVDNYLASKVGNAPTVNLEQGSEKSALEILQIKREQAEKQHKPKFTIKSTNKAALEEYDLKSALYQSVHANKSFNRNPTNHQLYHALMEALIKDENTMDKGVTDTVKDHKRKHDDDEDDDDEDPLAGLNQGKKTKRRRTKKSDSSKKPSSTKEIPKGKAPSKGSKTGKSTPEKEPNDNQPEHASKPKTTKILNPDWFKQPPRPPTPDPEWNKCQCFNPFDLSNPLPLEGPPCHRTVAVDYFFNNDLEYLKTSDPEVTYTTSITKTKAARYEIKGIKDMVSKFSKQNVYSTKEILGVKSVSVKKLHGYGHLEEIMVKRSDQQLYKFKEGDFVDLHLNDIEDMLLLVVQHKLFHLDGSVFVDFIVALRMFTRSLILKRRVEDLQLGVERIVYEDLDKQKRVLRADELHRFSDGTLKSIHDEIHHRVLDFCLDYNTKMPTRKWTAVDRKRSGLMFKLIDKQMQEREIIRNQERLVGARKLDMEYKLMTRTV
ncbi:hypothetical protein Tco_0309619 [Tanacetum coccineum]